MKESKFLVQETGYAFKDVLIAPQVSRVRSRKDVDLTTSIARNAQPLHLPIAGANMDTVTESVMAIHLAREGAIGVIHRNLTPQKQADEVRKVKSQQVIYENGNGMKRAAIDTFGKLMVAAAIGANKKEDLVRVELLVEAGVDIIMLDIAQGGSILVQEMLNLLKGHKNIKTPIVAGNVATEEGVHYLLNSGADGVKIGVGAGYVCTTRNIAGVGVPQLTAIGLAREAMEKTRFPVPIIADGGIREPGDVAKAIAAGADVVMIGSLFAGTLQSPGERVEIDGIFHKKVRGMASNEAHQLSLEIIGNTDPNAGRVAEGTIKYVPLKGDVSDVLDEIEGGVRSAMSYSNAFTIQEFQKNALFIKVTPNGADEQNREFSK